MSERTCVCGHKESEHEPAAGELVCFHEMDPENPKSDCCECMAFRPAESEAVPA